MSEQERGLLERVDEGLSKIDKACTKLDRVKKWYNAVTIGSVLTIISVVGGLAVGNYKITRMEIAISKAAPRSTIMQLDQVYQAQTNAMINLSEVQYQEALRKFEAECAKIRSNIIMWNSEINVRGGGGNKGSVNIK